MSIEHNLPLLFPANEFKPGVNIKNICKTYGYGRIDKVIESTITESAEEYSLEMDVHSSSNVFHDLKKFNIILANGQLFRIYDTEYDSEKQIKNVYAKHITYDLDFDSVYNLKYKENNKKVVDVIQTILNASQYNNFFLKHNLGRFKLQTYKEDINNATLFEAILEVIEGFTEECAENGNDIEVEITRDNNNIGLYLYEANKDYTNSQYRESAGIGKDTGIRLDLKKIKKIEITESDDDFCTKVIVRGKDDKVVKDITHPELGNAGLPFWITKVVDFTEESDTAKLRKLGQSHIIVNSLNIKNIKISVEDIIGTDFFRKITMYQDLKLYDKIWVKHPDISETYVQFRIVKIERNIEGTLTGLEFGELNNDFIKTLKKAIKKYS